MSQETQHPLAPFVGREISLQLRAPWFVHAYDSAGRMAAVVRGPEGQQQPAMMAMLQGIVTRPLPDNKEVFAVRVDVDHRKVDVIPPIDLIGPINLAVEASRISLVS